MKTPVQLYIASGLLFISLGASAQKDSSGIYQTAEDFRNHNLSYAINYKTEKHKIKDWLFMDASQVKVKHHDSTYTLDKNNTYGYKSTSGEVFRFVDNTAYKILNPDEELLLYVHTAPTDIKSNPTRREEEHYYFSKDAAGLPMMLTIDNLKKEYRDNQKFLALIDKYFKTDQQLISYNEKQKVYTLNQLLQMSKQ